jgi:DNA repair protein RecO (recombination protein O)
MLRCFDNGWRLSYSKMRPSHVTPAIVLRTRPFGESDKIVSFFTENFGKLTGIAKGAMRSRRRFMNSLEPFALVNLRFQDPAHSNLVLIQSTDLVSNFSQLLTSLERISYASYLVDITDGLLGEREENQKAFQHLMKGLNFVEKNETSLQFLTSFELKLLRLVGYQPFLDNCKRCHKDYLDYLKHADSRWYFSPVDGGILCDSCGRSRKEILPLGAAAIEVLGALQAEALDPSSRLLLPRSIIREIRAAVLGFIQFHMDREIKSASFLSAFSSVESGTLELVDSGK